MTEPPNPLQNLTCSRCVFSRTAINPDEAYRDDAEPYQPYSNDDDDDASIVQSIGKEGNHYLHCHRHSPGPSLIPVNEMKHHEPQITVFPLVHYDSFCGEGMTPEMIQQKEGE